MTIRAEDIGRLMTEMLSSGIPLKPDAWYEKNQIEPFAMDELLSTIEHSAAVAAEADEEGFDIRDYLLIAFLIGYEVRKQYG